MVSAAKFWPTRLFGRGRKTEPTAFVPTTEIAARIVGKPLVPSQFPGGNRDPDAAEKASAGSEPEAAVVSERQADRFVPDKTVTFLTDKRGKQSRARIINISATGVAVEGDFGAMPADTVAMVGSKPVTVGRTIRRGQVFLFDKPLDPSRCNRQIVL